MTPYAQDRDKKPNLSRKSQKNGVWWLFGGAVASGWRIGGGQAELWWLGSSRVAARWRSNGWPEKRVGRATGAVGCRGQPGSRAEGGRKRQRGPGRRLGAAGGGGPGSRQCREAAASREAAAGRREGQELGAWRCSGARLGGGNGAKRSGGAKMGGARGTGICMADGGQRLGVAWPAGAGETAARAGEGRRDCRQGL
ncbi:glycine-rich cell wall structural protein 1.8-like [Cryptomeria japonica]|uniref:glycine-rich cell wall structural protein 1.8-like n=1 Tax=Cryptomeria japonica TaxID=3369 RepID=UPI0027DA25BE|nr:glycine-rich cell wall structural protein 1.8-like [Cryptomeria japonica]